MKITEQQLFDYIYCPCKYSLKYLSKINIEAEKTQNDILNTTAKFFYTSILNNSKLPTLTQIKTKLDRLCEENKENISSKKAVEMWGLIYNFYNWACDNKVAVIDVDTRYALPIGEHILEGVMNPIAINKSKEFESLIMNFSSRTPEQLAIDTKLKYTIDMLAFNTLQNENMSGIRIHSVKHNKDFFTTRTLNDYERLKNTVNSVVKGIQNSIYYPRETFLCSSCEYRNYCRAWK